MNEPAQADVGRVTVESDWEVATVCLDRPEKHNALTPEMLEQLEQILVALDSDRDVRVVLLTAVGDRSFCAGADIKRFKMLQPLDMWRSEERRVGKECRCGRSRGESEDKK